MFLITYRAVWNLKKGASFGTKLKALRTDLDLKQADVAEKLGVSQSVYGNYEQDKRSPDFDTLVKLCLLYHVSADYLLGVPNADGRLSVLFSMIQSMQPADRQRVAEYVEMLFYYRKYKKT